MKKIILALILMILHTNAQKTLYEKALTYQKTEHFNDALTAYDEIIQNNPHNLNALFNQGYCYLALGMINEAIKTFDKILSIDPTIMPVLYNKAYTQKTAGMIDEAIALYHDIIEKDPTYEPAHLGLGFAYLAKGDFVNGWKYHGRYLKKSGKNADELRMLLETDAIPGKIIVLTAEGGLGDSLQFIRYAQRLHDMGAYTIAYVQKSLVPLLSLCPYIDEIISNKDPMPMHNAHASLMSMPAIFNDTENTFPSTIPYLFADQTLINEWKEALSNDHHFKVGICWQADVHNDRSRLPIARRGCPLQVFAMLQEIPDVSFYSLQKYEGVEELATIPSEFVVHHFDDLDEKSGPFLETAALMENLDLVITVDTAIAHLAGGLGRTVWLLLPYSTDWRWIYNRTDSPWYPTMRIFKQNKPEDWRSVMHNLYNELMGIIM